MPQHRAAISTRLGAFYAASFLVVGIQTPSNLLFFGSLIVLFAVSLQLSREVGLLEEQSRRLAEEIGTLRMRVDALEKPPDE